MLVPSNRLIFGCAVTLLPAALLVAVNPQMLWFAVGVALLAVASVLDALWMRGWSVTFALPEVTNFSCGRAGEFCARLSYPAALQGRTVRLTLDLPQEAGVADAVLDCRLPKDAEHAQVAWACRSAKRGSLLVRHAACEMTSPWGLWHVVRRQNVRSVLRVYPDLRGEQRRLAPVFLRHANVGAHVCRLAGKGREFEKLREYVPGDDLGDIHWKATARRNFPVTKVFQAERTQEAYIVLDASRLSGRLLGDDPDSASQSVLDQYIQTALTLVLAAERLGDRCGLIVFHRMVVRFLPADSGKQHFDACRNALYMLQTEPVAPDFHEMFAFMRLRVPKRALMLFLTHIDTPALAESFLEASRLVLRQHLLAVPLFTSHDARPLFSSPPPGTLDDAFRDFAGHLHWRNLKALERQLRVRGVHTSLASVRDATAALGAHYLTVKARQLL